MLKALSVKEDLMIEISNEARGEIEKVIKESPADSAKAVRIFLAGHG
jgi:hypothetical protein